MKIKTTDLRVGNLMNAAGYILVTSTVTEFHLFKMWEDATEYFDGIILTEEWLVKLGFKKFKAKIGKGYYLQIEANGPDLYYDKETGISLTTNEFFYEMSHIKYVHQVQNLYFALTGEELKPIT